MRLHTTEDSFSQILALSTMASSRFVDPPEELRACSEAFHAEALKHLDAVFEEQSYGMFSSYDLSSPI